MTAEAKASLDPGDGGSSFYVLTPHAGRRTPDYSVGVQRRCVRHARCTPARGRGSGETLEGSPSLRVELDMTGEPPIDMRG